jgi:MarR family transcriptional regulator, organic hydroperoxide resistance regulator
MTTLDYRKACNPANSEFRLDMSPFYLMAHADFDYHADMSAVLGKHGVTKSMYRIMTVLRDNRVANIGFLAQRSLTKRNTVSRIVERMVAKGLARANPNSTDSRVTEVELTQRGKHMLDTLTPIVGRQFQRALAGVSNEELEQLVRVLRKISGNLNRHLIETDNAASVEGLVRSYRLPAGQVWTIGFDAAGSAFGLSTIETVHERDAASRAREEVESPQFLASAGIASHLLETRRRELLGNDEARGPKLSVRRKSFGAGQYDCQVGASVLVALCSAYSRRPAREGLIVIGNITAEGAAEAVDRPTALVELAVTEGAKEILMPVSCRRALVDLPDEIATQVEIHFYAAAADVIAKALSG